MNNFVEGTCCKFTQINEEWGLKTYESKSLREYTWNLQNIAYKNIEPKKQYNTKNLSLVRIIKNAENDYTPSFGTPLAPEPAGWIDSEKTYSYLSKVANTKTNQKDSDVKFLMNSLRAIGVDFPADDFNRKENLGYISGSLVCIDFDAFQIRISTHGGLLQSLVSRPDENISQCDIHEDVKQILDWKSK